jgi:hypothetical protein
MGDLTLEQRHFLLCAGDPLRLRAVKRSERRVAFRPEWLRGGGAFQAERLKMLMERTQGTTGCGLVRACVTACGMASQLPGSRTRRTLTQLGLIVLIIHCRPCSYAWFEQDEKKVLPDVTFGGSNASCLGKSQIGR